MKCKPKAANITEKIAPNYTENRAKHCKFIESSAVKCILFWTQTSFGSKRKVGDVWVYNSPSS